MKYASLFSSALVCTVISLTIGASVAFAQITVGTRDTESVSITAGSGFIVSLKEKNSYCCTLFPQGPNTNAGLSDTIEELGNSNNTARGTLRGDMEPAVSVDTESSSTDQSQMNNRLCVIPGSSGNYKFPIASANSGETVKVACDNTTLNGGFNTNATPFNFLECTNVTDATISGKIYAVDFSGQTLIDGTDINISPGLRQDYDIHSSVGANRYGRLFVVHDGTKGALKCVLSRYSEDFTLRSSLPLE